MKTNIRISRLFVAFVLSLSMFLLDSCGVVKKAHDIEITSVGVKSISPNGLKSIDGVLLVGVDNPTIAFTIKTFEGTVYKNGQPFATYSGGPISVKKKSSDVYELPATLNIDPSVSIFNIISLATSMNFEGFTTDVAAKVALKSGLATTLTYKDMKIDELLDMAN